MGFNWLEYLNLSKELVKTRSEESAMRSAISRAYYGVFGTLKPYCVQTFSLPHRETTDPKIHQRIIERLKASSNRLEYSIGNTLSTMRDDRNIADYDSSVAVTSQKAQKSIVNAEMILSNLENLREEH